MIITEVRTTPLRVPYSQPYLWAQGTTEDATVILVEVVCDEGIVGIGECAATGPGTRAVEAFVRAATAGFTGESPFANARLIADAYQRLFREHGTGSAPRFAGQILAGPELALWDLAGKLVRRPVHELLGGAVRDHVSYFGFAQGPTAAAVAEDARQLVDDGFDVIYIKLGIEDALDLETVAAVREAIGPRVRLRVDANERWAPLQARAMMRKLDPYGVECVEQPTHCEIIGALAQVRATSRIPVAADQAVYNAADAYDVCRLQAADLIVAGVHEAGGILGLRKIAHVAESAGIKLCLHGVYETGITTCASNQVAATIANLDDGNQHMKRFLQWDIVTSPDLTPVLGRLPVITGHGLGFELDWDNVERAREGFLANER
jgi:muconate cycloisomerase